MATTPTFVTRTDDSSGDAFLTFDIPGGEKAQGVVIIDENGAQAGITGTPIVVSVSGSVTVTGTVTANLGTQAADIDVNVTNVTPIPVSFSSGTLIQYVTGGTAEASAVILGSATASSLKELRVILDPAATTLRYAMLFNAAALPANGTAPAWRGLVPPAGEMSESWPDGLDFTAGIVVAISESVDTLTIAPAEAFFNTVRS